MNNLLDIPELQAWDNRQNLIRIPSQQDVPVTQRIRLLVDSHPFQRLASLRQLGLVSLVYPGATHSRFEHSLGVYRMSLMFLKRLATFPAFCERITPHQAEVFLVTSLLHDIGHWPYCHPIEDMGLPHIPQHESLARYWLENSEVGPILQRHFHCTIGEVVDLLQGAGQQPAAKLLQSLLSGPVDVDKMDYLYRDSLHAGVPYGMHYDGGRLIGSLCLDESSAALALTEKGSTAAELMVFARYVMFREVYWHHAVRSATAMLQRAFYQLQPSMELDELYRGTDQDFQKRLISAAQQTDAAPLVEGIFGGTRHLYKRLAEFTILEDRETFERISRRPYGWLVHCAAGLAEQLARRTGLPIQTADILIDAPPANLEVQFRISVHGRDGQYRPLGDVSPVVKALATEQFDNHVKRVRIFHHPRFPDLQTQELDLPALLEIAIQQAEAVPDP